MPTIRITKPRLCEQRCGQQAKTYAIDPIPGGWGGWYCDACAKDLGFMIEDRFETMPWVRKSEPQGSDRDRCPVDEWSCENCATPLGYNLHGDDQGGWTEYYEAGDRMVCEDCLPPDEGFHVCDICRMNDDDPLHPFTTLESSWLLAYEPTAVAKRVCPSCATQADEYRYLVMSEPTLAKVKLIYATAGNTAPEVVTILSTLADQGYEGKW